MGQENRLLAAQDNPLGDYMQDRSKQYMDATTRDLLFALLNGAGAGTAFAVGAPYASGLFGLGAFANANSAMNNSAAAGDAMRGQQMWSNTGMPGRPMAPPTDVNRLLQGN